MEKRSIKSLLLEVQDINSKIQTNSLEAECFINSGHRGRYQQCLLQIKYLKRKRHDIMENLKSRLFHGPTKIRYSIGNKTYETTLGSSISDAKEFFQIYSQISEEDIKILEIQEIPIKICQV